jgi:hypothetical protein
MTHKIAVAVFLCVGVVQAQQLFRQKAPFPYNPPRSAEEFKLTLVERLISLPSPVTVGAVQLHGMGDEAAVDVLKILGVKPSLTAAQQQATLDVLHMAFEQPASIIDPVNEKPQAAAFLLQYLGSTTTDAAVKQRIAEETAFVQAASAATPPTAK